MDDSEFLKIYWQQYMILEKRMIGLSDYVEDEFGKERFSLF